MFISLPLAIYPFITLEDNPASWSGLISDLILLPSLSLRSELPHSNQLSPSLSLIFSFSLYNLSSKPINTILIFLIYKELFVLKLFLCIKLEMLAGGQFYRTQDGTQIGVRVEK